MNTHIHTHAQCAAGRQVSICAVIFCSLSLSLSHTLACVTQVRDAYDELDNVRARLQRATERPPPVELVAKNTMAPPSSDTIISVTASGSSSSPDADAADSMALLQAELKGEQERCATWKARHARAQQDAERARAECDAAQHEVPFASVCDTATLASPCVLAQSEAQA